MTRKPVRIARQRKSVCLTEVNNLRASNCLENWLGYNLASCLHSASRSVICMGQTLPDCRMIFWLGIILYFAVAQRLQIQYKFSYSNKPGRLFFSSAETLQTIGGRIGHRNYFEVTYGNTAGHWPNLNLTGICQGV